MAYGSGQGRQLHTLHSEAKLANIKSCLCFKEARYCMPNATNLEVRLEDVFCTSGDQLTNSYSLRFRKKETRMTQHKEDSVRQ